MRIVCDTPEQVQALKDKALMLRMVALDELQIPPLTNLSSISKRKQQKVEALILNKWEMPMCEIKELFDRIICDDVLDPKTAVIDALPCSDVGVPDLPEDYKQMLKEQEQNEMLKEQSV